MPKRRRCVVTSFDMELYNEATDAAHQFIRRVTYLRDTRGPNVATSFIREQHEVCFGHRGDTIPPNLARTRIYAYLMIQGIEDFNAGHLMSRSLYEDLTNTLKHTNYSGLSEEQKFLCQIVDCHYYRNNGNNQTKGRRKMSENGTDHRVKYTQIMGYAVTATIKLLANLGYSRDQIRLALHNFGVEDVKSTTLATNIAMGRRGDDKNPVAKMNKTEIKKLTTGLGKPGTDVKDKLPEGVTPSKRGRKPKTESEEVKTKPQAKAKAKAKAKFKPKKRVFRKKKVTAEESTEE